MLKKRILALALALTMIVGGAVSANAAESPCEHDDYTVVGSAAPSCYDGWELVQCNVCGQREYTSIPAVGHVYENDVCIGCGAVHDEHDWVEVDRIAATCETPAYVWYACSECDAEKNGEVGEPEHTIVHVEAKAPTCEEEGNVEYWYCAGICAAAWADEALTQLTNHMNVKIPVGHTNVVHVEAVAPGCHYEGNIEYWICYDCETVWADEALTQLTNIKNVVLPAVGGEVVAHEAVEPGCHYDGNIAYWTCDECEQVWADEALTQLTNIKNVVLPAVGGEVIYVAAKAPTATENGNIEYWYCEECEQVWQNEALTQLTNIKNVVLPATGEVADDENKAPETGDKSPETGDKSPETGDNAPIVVYVVTLMIAAAAVVVALKKRFA